MSLKIKHHGRVSKLWKPGQMEKMLRKKLAKLAKRAKSNPYFFAGNLTLYIICAIMPCTPLMFE
jgi:hypothetical protein